MVAANAPPHQTLWSTTTTTQDEGTINLDHGLTMEQQAEFMDFVEQLIDTLDAQMPGLLQPGPLSLIYFEDDPVIVSPDVGAGYDDDDDDEDMEADEGDVADEAEQQEEESDSDTDTVINAYLDPSPMWCDRAPIID